ncbi:serine protease inhibitor, Kazal-type family protein [Melia azedarach]|uniref:Serine protease inhibitor, Kazal-type family protein n=1 Tax=Melia azedarach TaxID=155640 RepID=A0ACC1YY56_MELAZ|nr:serine protease inhibitor, Kazal-type family protein [Melia azedarach]
MNTFSAANRLIVILLMFLVLDIGSQLVQSTREDDGVCGGFTRPDSCPINCFRADPVCGVDGVTYWCGCPDATCAGVKVAKTGFCEVGSGGSASLPGQALLLVHIVWLFLLAFSLVLGVF